MRYVKRCFAPVLIAALLCAMVAGCTIPRHIEPIRVPPDQVPLQELEQHLDYRDPDAGKPNYVRNR